MKLIYIWLTLMISLYAKDYNNNKDTIDVISTLVDKHGFNRYELKKLFSDVTIQKSSLRVYQPKKKKKERTKEEHARLSKLYPKHGGWDRYSRLKTNPSRVKQGVAFIKKYKKTFDKVEERYGVPKEYLAAIIGVETVYGTTLGKYPVFDTLATLSFEQNRRENFFRKELIKYLMLSKSENFNPKNVYGSYAGAIGYGQFMPSSYKAYGVDYDGDGKVKLFEPRDAIASVGNYLKRNGWATGEVVATRVTYDGKRFSKYKTGYIKTYNRSSLKGIKPKKRWDYHKRVRLIKLDRKNNDELWYGAKNFFVITRYNHSSYYAMSIHQLAQKIKNKMRK